jgi:hypothetical protein
MYIMPYSSKVALSRGTLVNQNQGGGSKKMGLIPRENIPASVARSYKNHKQSLVFTQTLQPHQIGVSPLAGGIRGLVIGARQ